MDTREDGRICLRETAGLRGKYTALSYCWSKEDKPGELKLTKANADEFRKDIAIERMPPTIRDAIFAAKSLGFEFIWVDRFCIIQDDPEDWKAEANSMATVYEFAALTIAAVGADDPEDGCFLPREQGGMATLQTERGNIFISQLRGTFDANGQYPALSVELLNSRWASRAWTFQERLFSRRIVYYGKSQIVWECRQSIDTESGLGLDSGYNFWGSNYLTAADPRAALRSMISRNQRSLGSNSGPSDDSFKWHDIVAQYSTLDLTYEKDRRPAIESTMRLIATSTGVELCAGMFLEGIQKHLFWWPFSGDERFIQDMLFHCSQDHDCTHLVELYWDLDRPTEDQVPFWLGWETDPRCTSIWINGGKVNVFWGRLGSRRTRMPQLGGKWPS